MTDNKLNTSVKATEQNVDALPTLRPLVSIIEADNGFTLTAEMPGVPKGEVSVHVENNTLTLEGIARLDTPDGIEVTHAEVQAARYKRAFTLSRELNAGKISASQTDGVLTLHIPKVEQAQPRKIEVQIG